MAFPGGSMSNRFLLSCALAIGLCGPVAAQDSSASISLELNNAISSAEGTCQVVFLGKNGLDVDISSVTWRLGVFDKEGSFKNLLALPLGALSAGKRRIVQFNLPSSCDELSEIILNDVAECEIGNAASDLCMSELSVSSRADIKFGL